jgi:DNA end-binding protein Ku
MAASGNVHKMARAARSGTAKTSRKPHAAKGGSKRAHAAHKRGGHKRGGDRKAYEAASAAAGRPSWKGYLKLSLVTCAVALYPAETGAEKITFVTLNRDSGERVRRLFVDAESGKVVEPDDQVRGFETGEGEHVMVEEEELDALRLESTHTIDVERFVGLDEVDPIYLSGAHYLVPDDPVALEAFAVIRDTMRREKVAGLAKLVLNRRERMLLLTPDGNGMIAATLRYPYEVRSDADIFERIGSTKPDAKTLELGDRLVESRRGRFKPDEFKDEFEKALLDLVRARMAGRKPRAVEEPEAPAKGGNVINLMDALRRSIASGKQASNDDADGEARPRKRKAAPRRRAAPKHRKAD